MIACAVVAVAGCGSAQAPTRRAAERATALRSDKPSRSPDVGEQPWPRFGRDARHSFESPVSGPQTGHVRWRRRLEGAVVPGPVVGARATVYAASNGGVLHAIDLRTGADRWRFDGGATYGSDLSTSPALLPDGTVLWPGPGALYALSPRGRLLWRIALASTVLSPVLGDGGRLYIAEMSGVLRAYTLRGHARPVERWHVALGGTSFSSPALDPRGRIVTTAGRTLAAVADRGSRAAIAWRVAAREISEVSPAVGPDGVVVFGTNDPWEYGVAPDGRVRWRHPRRSFSYSSAAVTADGLAYFGDHKGFVTVVDASTGALRARYLGRGRTPRVRSVGVWTAPVIDGRHDVYFGTRLGHVHGFAADGHRLFDIDTGATVDSNPALAADGTLLIGSESGDLYAIG
jgi:outer membrane protein assembly factor BamB